MKFNLLLVLLCFCTSNCWTQNETSIISPTTNPVKKHRWASANRFGDVNGINVSYSHQIHSAIDIGYSRYLSVIMKKKISGTDRVGFDRQVTYTFAYWTAGSSIDIFLTRNFILGPRLYSNFTYGYFSSQINFTAYTDFNTFQPVITPEIGIGRFIGIRYGYNIKLSKNAFTEIGKHKITVFINTKFGRTNYKSIRHTRDQEVGF